MVNCVVSQCKSCYGKSANGEKISFHKFPMAKKLRMEWEKRIGRKNLKCSIHTIKTARLCSLHFTDDCYSVSRTTATSMGHTLTRWKLKDDAVPTLFNDELDGDSHDGVKKDTKMAVKAMEKIISAQENEVKGGKHLHNDNKTEIIKDMNNTICTTEGGFKLMSKGQTYCQTSKISLENEVTFSRSEIGESEARKVSPTNEKDSDLKKVEMESDSRTDDSSSNATVQSLKDEVDSGDAVNSHHEHEPSTDCLSMDLTSEEISLNDSCLSKEPPLSSREYDKSNDNPSFLRFLCEVCGIHFSDQVQFNYHSASCSSRDYKIMDCNIKAQTNSQEKNCQEEKGTEASRVIQVSLSDYEKGSASTFFVCACGFTASSSVELVAHSSSHTMEATSVCSVCSVVYHSILLLQQHVHKNKHFWTLEGKLPSPNLAGKPEPRSTSIPAPGIISQPMPLSHFLGALSSQTPKYFSDGRVGAMDLTINGLEHVGVPLKCDFCPFSSFSARDLLNHRKVHLLTFGKKPESELKQSDGGDAKLDGFAKDDGLLKCDSCGYSTRSAIELLQHKTYHSSEGPFKCNTCSYATISAIDLLQHKKDQSCLSKQC